MMTFRFKMLPTLVFLFIIPQLCVCMNKLHPQEYICRSDLSIFEIFRGPMKKKIFNFINILLFENLVLLANVLNFRRTKTGGYDLELKINHQIEVILKYFNFYAVMTLVIS